MRIRWDLKRRGGEYDHLPVYMSDQNVFVKMNMFYYISQTAPAKLNVFSCVVGKYIQFYEDNSKLTYS